MFVGMSCFVLKLWGILASCSDNNKIEYERTFLLLIFVYDLVTVHLSFTFHFVNLIDKNRTKKRRGMNLIVVSIMNIFLALLALMGCNYSFRSQCCRLTSKPLH